MSYISVNRSDLCFVHKHHLQTVCSALAWLEMPHKCVVIENTEQFFLSTFTLNELRQLYKNTFGHDAPKAPANNTLTTQASILDYWERFLQELFLQYVGQLKPTLALEHEVQAQIELVEDRLYAGEPFTYALGSKRPAQPGELFPLKCDAVASEADVARAAVKAAQPRPVVAATPTPASPESAPTPASAPRQRSSSVRPAIWQVADDMWKAAGSPKDKNVVLELRKKMMVELDEKHGIKKNTSSNELGNWMKDRLA